MADRTEAAFSWSEGWNPVSAKLTSARRLTLALVYVLVVAGIIALFVVPSVPSLADTAFLIDCRML